MELEVANRQLNLIETEGSVLRLGTIDCLRGIAVSGVCLYHFTNGNGAFLPEGYLKSFGSFGLYGVQIFFVISGFILTYSMVKSRYHIADFFRFIQKRFIRLEPPYLMSILAALFIGSVAGIASGNDDGFQIVSPSQILSHLGYTTDIVGQHWINPVYWTLAIEFQFYLLISLLFPLIMAIPRWAAVIVLIGVTLLGFVLSEHKFVFHHWCLFQLGMITCFRREKLIGNVQVMMLLTITISCGTLLIGGAAILAGIATACAIAWWQADSRLLRFLGGISYSLYLLHGPIGIRVINLSMRFEERSFLLNVAAVGVATLASVGGAYLFWFWIEKPAQSWASKIRYSAASRFAKTQA